MKQIKKDPETYLQLSAPFENTEDANNAMQSFYEELGELRKKHKIRDLLVVTYGSVKTADGESEFLNSMSYGNTLNALPMAAYAYGQEKQSHGDVINSLLIGKK